PFTLDQVRTFLTVAAHEHVTHASRALNLSQSAVTQQVRTLERALGVRLLQRVGRNVRLTDAGAEVAISCMMIMRAIDNLDRPGRSCRDLEKGWLAVGATQVTATYWLPAVILDFSADHPRIEVDVRVGRARDVFEGVRSGELECGLVDGEPSETSLVASHVGTDELIVATDARHRLIRRGSRAPAAHLDATLLVWDEVASESISRQMLGSASERLREVRLGSLEAVRRSVLAGQGLAILPLAAVG